MQCFVINLPKDTERKPSISEELQKAGIEFSIIEAVNGAELLQNGTIADFYNEEKAVSERYRKMTAGEIGCALSHMKIYRKMQDENISHALVMEDDIYIKASHFRELIEKAERLCDENSPTVTLFSHIKRYVKTKESQRLDETYAIHDYYRGGSAYCYLITKSAAKKCWIRFSLSIPLSTNGSFTRIFFRLKPLFHTAPMSRNSSPLRSMPSAEETSISVKTK